MLPQLRGKIRHLEERQSAMSSHGAKLQIQVALNMLSIHPITRQGPPSSWLDSRIGPIQPVRMAFSLRLST